MPPKDMSWKRRIILIAIYFMFICSTCFAWYAQSPKKISKQEYEEIMKYGNASFGSDPYCMNITWNGKQYYYEAVKGTEQKNGWSVAVARRLYFQGYLIYEENINAT